MKLMQITPYNTSSIQQRTSFKGYTAKQICSELCKGACCDHGTPMSANLKKIADKICAQYYKVPDDIKSTILIKAPIVKWVVNSQNPDVNAINKLANTYIDAISRESNPQKVEQLSAELEKLNNKLIELTESEPFIPVTNEEMRLASLDEVATNGINVCMFKDHGKTNLCTIYDGVEDESGQLVGRPRACLAVGGEDLPCPWHHPEKYIEVYRKTKAQYARYGYYDVPQEVIQSYIAHQFNLNETFNEKIWQPYLKTLDIKG